MTSNPVTRQARFGLWSSITKVEINSDIRSPQTGNY